MSAVTMLARLVGVKPAGKDRWLARCPAHVDRSPSLSIRELDGGRQLVHCWAGCETSDVLAAIGLEFTDLFPEPLTGHAPRERRPFNAADVLAALSHEATVVMLCAADVAAEKPVNHARLLMAVKRIGNAIEECGHGA